MTIGRRNRMPGELYPGEIRQLILSIARERQNFYESQYAADYSERLQEYQARKRRKEEIADPPPAFDTAILSENYKAIFKRAEREVLDMLALELPPEFDDE